MNSNYYIYYSVPPEIAASARRAVMALFAELKAGTGVSGRLMRRHDDPGTWMEIYEHVTDAGRFEQVLRAGEARNGLDGSNGERTVRKTEIFIEDVLEPPMQPGGTACA